jgi:hypothetical protein
VTRHSHNSRRDLWHRRLAGETTGGTPVPQSGCARGPRRAFSLLETTIAMGILGVGLIMVAAIFPVALTQHRQSTEQARAIDMVAQAKTLLHNRLDPNRLWVDPVLYDAGLDTPWYFMPLANLRVRGGWEFNEATDYADALNDAPLGSSSIQFLGKDVLSDRIAPPNDLVANEAPNRFIWYGFYRQLANGSMRYATAVCKQRRNQIFYMQDMSIADPEANPTARGCCQRRFPLPWRVRVARIPGTNQLFHTVPAPPTDVLNLSDIAPAGSKIMLLGFVDADAAPIPTVPAGRVLTIANAIENPPAGTDAVQVVEDISDIASNAPLDAGDNNVVFDVWLFPPAHNTTASPLREWKVSL